MTNDLRPAWHAAFAEWLAAHAAQNNAAPDLPPHKDQAIDDREATAWLAVFETPAPTWSEVAWKVRQLLTPQGHADTTPPWSAGVAAYVLADIDRLLGIPDQQNRTTREYQSHAAPDQQKSEEIIVADTANSTGSPKPEVASQLSPSPIRQLVLMRETAERRSEECSGADMVDVTAADRHWDRQYRALGLAIMAEVPLSVADAFSVLHCVAEMREIAAESSTTGFANLVNSLDCTELTSAAISNCLPVLAAAVAAGDLTPGQHRSAALAAKHAQIRENGNG